MAMLNPIAGQNDVLLTCVVSPPGATIHGNAIGECVDLLGDPAVLPPGYSFVEISQFQTGVRCPNVADAIDAPDVLVRQKADADMSAGEAFLNAETFSIKTIAPTAAALNSSAAVVGKLP